MVEKYNVSFTELEVELKKLVSGRKRTEFRDKLYNEIATSLSKYLGKDISKVVAKGIVVRLYRAFNIEIGEKGLFPEHYAKEI